MTSTYMNETAAKELALALAKDETMGWTYSAIQVSAKWWRIEVRDEEGFVVS